MTEKWRNRKTEGQRKGETQRDMDRQKDTDHEILVTKIHKNKHIEGKRYRELKTELASSYFNCFNDITVKPR